MDKKLLQELKQKLEKEKTDAEKELQKFAKKDKNLEGDWDTKFPKFDKGSGQTSLETMADEVEEYESLLPVEHALELRLRDINIALKKIKSAGGKYGICENCEKEIGEERLRAYPEARLCLKCKK